MYLAYIKGVGSYLPSTILSNTELTETLGCTDDWIVSRTGIHERRIIEKSEATSDLAYFAAEQALRDGEISPEDIDMIIVATETPDHVLPPVSCQVQQRLGCRTIPAFDLHNTCVGFLSALQVAEQYIKLGTHQNILVIGADSLTRFTDYSDLGTSIIFGDGAGAIILSRSEKEAKGLISTTLHADGKYFDALYIPGGGSRFPVSEENKNKMVMDGRKIFKLAVKSMSEVLTETLKKTGIEKEEIDWFIPHQANFRIMEAVARNLDFPLDKVINTVSYFGNSCSATIPIALDTAIKDGRIQRGDMLAMVSFGAGLVWGSALVEY
ncbi:beta-ketoacyl-ACP synthase III [Neobacillus sp. 179-J 1A1 HS]|uniref:beta-ketoacyl-ACP synthase III n=1 Tax=Neobacillus driksii TaxID=3035913 RepID=UPI0035BC4A29